MGGTVEEILERLDQFQNQLVEMRSLIVSNEKNSPWMTKEETCKYLKIGKTKLNDLVSSGKLRALRVDGLIRIHKRDIDALMMFQKQLRKLTTPQRREVQKLSV